MSSKPRNRNAQSPRNPNRRALSVLASLAWVVISLGPLRAQDPFLRYDFEDGDLSDFYNPLFTDVCCALGGGNVCGGPVVADGGEVILTNSDDCDDVCPATGVGIFGVSFFVLRPETVQRHFPESRDYKLRVKVSTGRVNEVVVYLRGRTSLLEGAGGVKLNMLTERSYAFSVFPQGTDAESAFPDGALGLTEYEACHGFRNHPEWPGALTPGFISRGFAKVDPGFRIVRDQWYWLEITAHGDDDGGPVFLTGKIWDARREPPAFPQLVARDRDGFSHNDATRDPANIFEIGVLPNTTARFIDRQPFAEARIDDLSLARLAGCREPPLRATRTLWKDRAFSGETELPLYEGGLRYEVAIQLSDPRRAGDCTAPGAVTVLDVVPKEWDVSAVSEGGTADGSRIAWRLNLGEKDGQLPRLSYKVTARPAGRVSFRGLVAEEQSDYFFLVEGETVAVELGGVDGFRRGDVDGNGEVNLSDGIFLLSHLFVGGPPPSCPDAADAGDHGQLNVASAIFIFNFLFLGGAPPPAPGPSDCGPDRTGDGLGECADENC